MTSQQHRGYPGAPPGEIRVGDWTLLTRIGEGGMGVVHLARRDDGHRVALKVLRPHIVGDDEARERLAREVSSLGRIRSRWVAEIEDSDPWGPVPFVATRYVPGLSLHDHVHDEGPVEDLGWFAARLADGLHAVHSVGVLHRDVKPSNVLMEGRAPILIDFGLARVADDPRLTHTGWLLGTPGYLAPEILYGDDATTASDVHSWAATVAFAGLGRPPFGRGPGMAIMDRVRRGQHDLAGLPPELRGLLQAALAPEVLDRPTLHEIRVALGAALAPGAAAIGPESSDVAPCPATPPVQPPPTMPFVAAHASHPSRAPTAPEDHPADPVAPTAPEADPADSVPPTEGSYAPDAYAPPPRARPADDALTEWFGGDPDPVPPAPDLPARLRRLALGVTVLVLVAVCTARTPVYTIAGVLLVSWLLRAGSLASTRQLERRTRRGRRWYDALVLPLSYPWFFVAAVPGQALLSGWSLGLAVAAALVGYAAAAPATTILLAAGAVLGLSIWWGPGSARLRGPAGRLVAGASAQPMVWGVVVAMALISLFTATLSVSSDGVDWAPWDRPPLGGLQR